MKNPHPFLPTTRREFLDLGAKGIGLLAFSRFAPSFVVESVAAEAPRAEKDRTILVLVQLAGGNDGLNTVVPFADPHYRRLRPTLALGQDELLKVNDTVAFHRACAPLHALLSDGKLGIVQNVGYPNPNRSHFRSTEIWETASDSQQTLATGWLGRYFDNACGGLPAGTPCGVNISNEVPQSFLSERARPTFSLLPNQRGGRENRASLALLEAMLQQPGLAGHGDHDGNGGYLRHTMMDALVTEKRFQKILSDYRATAEYPGNPFASSLRNVAAFIASGNATRVYYVSLGGFDTHSNQPNQHANLLRTLSEGLAAFQRDLESKQLDGQVLTMTFSEFGRRPSENESRGTDHGTAAPLFVLGSRVKAGLHGHAPNLAVDHNEDLKFSTDFRAVYSTILQRWLGCDSPAVIGSTHAPLGFI
ncbi:MAG: twin-arginine translocation pathway signal protein [Opitutus sp.]|nr:twin-arginine translocation pathway signal protein [Opitutus sp.]